MTNKSTNYGSLAKQLVALIEDEVEPITIFSNISSLLYSNLPNVNWLGFYFIKNEELLLGPFQGQPACSHLKLDSGVCGDAVTQRNLINVEDVYEYPNHIFCDSNSKSEIVLPIFADNTVIGVLDIDAPTIHRFNKEDEANLQNIVELIERKLTETDLSIMTDVFINYIKK